MDPCFCIKETLIITSLCIANLLSWNYIFGGFSLQDKICSSILVATNLGPILPFSHASLCLEGFGAGEMQAFLQCSSAFRLGVQTNLCYPLSFSRLCIPFSQLFGIFESMCIVFWLLEEPCVHWTGCSCSVCQDS